MGWFTKREKMNMKTGKFEEVEPRRKELTREFYSPSSARLERQQRQNERKKAYREAYHQAALKASRKRAERQATRRYGYSTGEKLERYFIGSPPRKRSSSYRPSKPKKRKKTKSRRYDDYSLNFDPIDNWKW